MRIFDVFCNNVIRDWQEGIKPLCSSPGKAFLLRFLLEVSRGHVDSDTVSSDGAQCLLHVMFWEVDNRLAHDQAKLNFIVETDAPRTKNWTSVGSEYRGWRFEKKERLFGTDIVELFNVVASQRGISCVLASTGTTHGRRSLDIHTRNFYLYKLPCDNCALFCWQTPC